ncbi:hypothetical protein F4810DRAFT_659972 [Camillea tinctor]|nr:hypothetical protein F4810DRAFT_659972 [Camillea tinctor]
MQSSYSRPYLSPLLQLWISTPYQLYNIIMMTKLSPNISLYDPSGDTTGIGADALPPLASSINNKNVAPKLILICRWMDARDAHLAKYVTRYQALYPTAKIMLVKFTLTQLITNSKTRHVVMPVVTYLQNLVSSSRASGPAKLVCGPVGARVLHLRICMGQRVEAILRHAG